MSGSSFVVPSAVFSGVSALSGPVAVVGVAFFAVWGVAFGCSVRPLGGAFSSSLVRWGVGR